MIAVNHSKLVKKIVGDNPDLPVGSVSINRTYQFILNKVC